MRRPHPREVGALITRLPVRVAAVALTLGACAADGSSLGLTEVGQRGWEISRSNGCAACHGSNGEGGLAAAFVGLFGSAIELDDGTTVVVDRDFLAVSIADPRADQNADYDAEMPANNLSADEIDAVVEFIVELADHDGG